MNNSSEFEEVDLLVKKARIAQEKFERKGSQQLFDLACQAWQAKSKSCCDPFRSNFS